MFTCIILGPETSQGYSLSLLVFNMELKVMSSATRKEKEKRYIRIANEETGPEMIKESR